MTPVRLGAVEYLNARPLVYGLAESSRFSIRFDVPSQCASLLHGGGIDVGLIPSIEYLRGPAEARSGDRGYRIVPGLAIASRGPVASVAIYTTRPIADVRSIALDTSSRSSVALTRVMCSRVFRIQPEMHAHQPDLQAMLSVADAALIIGDKALFLEAEGVEKIDLGEMWTAATGLPFVYAFWVGRAGVLAPADVEALQAARHEGLANLDRIVRDAFPDARDRHTAGKRYLQDNIKYDFGPDERAGLELFYRYAAETGAVDAVGEIRFF